MKCLASAILVNYGSSYRFMEAHTLWRGEVQLIPATRAFRQLVSFAEHIWVQMLEDHCGRPNLLRPASISDELCDECCPDGHRFQWTAARSCFETHDARVQVLIYAKVVEEVCVRDLAAWRQIVLSQILETARDERTPTC